jgi:hypothetical protein
MAKQTINIGTAPNDGTGTPLRTAFDYCNLNFTELYTAVGPSGNNIVVPGNATITGDLTVDTNTFYVNSAANRVLIGTLSALGSATLSIAGKTQADTAVAGDVIGNFNNTSATGFGFRIGGGSATGGYALSVNNNTGSEFHQISGTGIATWSNVGGVAGTAMTLNATGLGVGASPANDRILSLGSMGILLSGATSDFNFRNSSGTIIQRIRYTDAIGGLTIGSANTTSYQIELGGSTTARAVTIDSSGNVGVGVTPSAWATSYKAFQIGQSASLSGFSSELAVFGSNCYFDTTDSRWERITSGFTSQYYQTSGTHVWRTGGTAGANTDCAFTQAMTLDASGNLLVGTTGAANARLDVRTSASQRIINAISTAAGDASTYGVYIGKFSNDSTTAQRFIGFTINNDGAGSGQINANGASQAAFGSFSDYRLKENIVSLPSQLANILSLRPVEFDYKDGSGHQIGFVAQEIQEVYADTVAEQDGFLTVTGWSKTEARLVSAIKELAAKVQALEAKLA